VKFFGWNLELRRAVAQTLTEEKNNQFESVLQRLAAAQGGTLGGDVTPENCMQAPTVQAIVTAITRRFAVTPVHVFQKGTKRGRETQERLPNHPVARLLQRPNSYQSRVDYWQDAASWLARYGRYYAFKSRGLTGPIRELLPMHPASTRAKQDRDTWAVTYQWNSGDGEHEYPASKVHAVRGPARNGYSGDSPVIDVRQAIALEMSAEKFGASFFQNGAMPLLVFSFMAASQGFKDKETEKQFIEDLRLAFGGGNAHKNLLLPKGIDKPTPVNIENDKSQFLETRKYQRTVIAGAWGVPPHLVGDLERATFNNVEQQDGDFTLNVIMPIGTQFEAAMERDLLTDDDRAGGVVIRFNFDSIMRADFKSRQEGLQIQRQNGVISSNEWREIERRNPLDEDDGGDEYIRPANMAPAGQPLPPQETPTEPDPREEAAEKLRSALKFAKGLNS
jgi:HK97 family phage portal protein